MDETRAQVDGEYGHSKQFAAMEMWRARHSRPFLNSSLLSFQITSSQVINFEAEEDTLISWTNRFVKDNLKTKAFGITRMLTTALDTQNNRKRNISNPGKG